MVKAKSQQQLVTDANQPAGHNTMEANEIQDDDYDSFDSDEDTEDENIKKVLPLILTASVCTKFLTITGYKFRIILK